MQSSDIPVKFNIPWADAAGGGFIRPIPEASQIGIEDGAASLTTGFPPLTFSPPGSGGVPPFGQDANGILFESTSWDRWFSAGGPIKYDSTFQAAVSGYPKGSILASATHFGVWWLSTTENNVTDPDAAGAGWVPITPLNYYGATDTGGGANTYIFALSPPLLINTVGLPIRIKPANSNTGASTLNVGPGAAAVVRRDGSPLIGGELISGRIATVAWNGTAYEWQGIAPATAAAITAGTDTQSAVTPAQFLGGLGSSIANPGYARLPSGLIVQWGTFTGASGSTVTFPIAFPTAVFITLAQTHGVANTGGIGTSATTTTLSLSFGSTPQSLDWLALGH